MNSKLLITKRFLLGYESTYATILDLDPKISLFLYRELLSILFPDQLLLQSSIVNRRGIAKENTIDLNVASSVEPASEELLMLLLENLNDEDRFDDRIQFTTTFKEFKGRDIVHSINYSSTNDQLEVYNIENNENTRVKEFRFGLEFFKPKLISILGLTPNIFEALKIIYSNNKLQIAISAYELAKRDQAVLKTDNLLNKISRSISNYTSIDLEADYKAKLNLKV